MADILHSIPISASPEAVYPLTSSGKGFTQWWAEDVSESADSVELGFFNRATVYRLKPKVRHHPSHAEWLCETGDEWNGTRLVFLIEPASAGSLLRFTHIGWRAQTDYFIACNTTWGELMFRLKAAAEGKNPGPLFLRDSLAY